MPEQTRLRRLLVLHGPTLESDGIVDFLKGQFEIHVVGDLESALAAMREQRFDAVLAETSDFLPLERGVVTQQAGLVLDTIGDGVCVVGPKGELAWANRQLKNFPEVVMEPLRQACLKAYEDFAAGAGADADRGRRSSIMPTDGTYYEVICSPVRDGQGNLRQVIAVVVNATSQRRLQLKLNAIDKAGRHLVGLDDEVLLQKDATQRLHLLEERIIRCIRDFLQYQHFAVLVLDRRNNRLETLITEGFDAEAEKYELFANPEGNGICGYVAATARSYICPDVTRDPRYLRGVSSARSSLTVPLRLHDRVVGVLNVESTEPAAYGEEDRQFAEIFANYVAMALHMLNLLVYERHSAATQVTGSIAAELAGPLNDIAADATELMEDYIGHDDLRKRLGTIIDNASVARKVVQELLSAPGTGVLGVPTGPVQQDPLLAGKRVLVADDEDLIRNTIRDVLVSHGCQVELARDGTKAMAMMAKARYELVISDIKMPGASGYEVFAAAKAACAETRVILITGFGYDPNHSIVRANREGLAAVLMKPFRARQLLEECRTALSAKA